jgi:hypothetical protein
LRNDASRVILLEISVPYSRRVILAEAVAARPVSQDPIHAGFQEMMDGLVEIRVADVLMIAKDFGNVVGGGLFEIEPLGPHAVSPNPTFLAIWTIVRNGEVMVYVYRVRSV